MKFFIFIFYLHYFAYSLKTQAKAKLDSSIDPFKALGIPDFKADYDDSKNSKKLGKSSISVKSAVRLNSINDLPKLFESGDLNSLQGFKSMTRFLTEDDDKLIENGGVFDETGFDGADAEAAELYKPGSLTRDKERAKSASLLYVKKTDPASRLEPYSCNIKDDENLIEWSAYEIVMMCCSGNMDIKRACIAKNEELAMIAFVLDPEDRCENHIAVADEFIERGLKYLKRIGMRNLAGLITRYSYF